MLPFPRNPPPPPSQKVEQTYFGPICIIYINYFGTIIYKLLLRSHSTPIPTRLLQAPGWVMMGHLVLGWVLCSFGYSDGLGKNFSMVIGPILSQEIIVILQFYSWFCANISSHQCNLGICIRQCLYSYQ